VPVPHAERGDAVALHESPEVLHLRSRLLAALEGPDAAA